LDRTPVAPSKQRRNEQIGCRRQGEPTCHTSHADFEGAQSRHRYPRGFPTRVTTRRISPLDCGLGRRDERRANCAGRRYRCAAASQRQRRARSCDGLKDRGRRVARLTAAIDGVSCSSLVTQGSGGHGNTPVDVRLCLHLLRLRGGRSGEHSLRITHHTHTRRRSHRAHEQWLEPDTSKIPNRHDPDECEEHSGASRGPEEGAEVKHRTRI
jgi:hypothetical protein